MKTFLVLEPVKGGRDAASADGVLFVRDRFRWTALLFAPIWLLWHGLWLGLLGWLVAVIALATLAFGVGLSSDAAAVLLWLPAFVVAFEGSELLRRKRLRQGYREAAVLVARDLEEAERRYFADWNESAIAQARRVASASPTHAASPNSIVGLFPQPGARQ